MEDSLDSTSTKGVKNSISGEKKQYRIISNINIKNYVVDLHLYRSKV